MILTDVMLVDSNLNWETLTMDIVPVKASIIIKQICKNVYLVNYPVLLVDQKLSVLLMIVKMTWLEIIGTMIKVNVYLVNTLVISVVILILETVLYALISQILEELLMFGKMVIMLQKIVFVKQVIMKKIIHVKNVNYLVLNVLH